MSKFKIARNRRIAQSYALGVRMSELAIQFGLTRQGIRYILQCTDAYPEYRELHWVNINERKVQALYRLCQGCGRGYIAKEHAQIYHNLACYHRSTKNA